MASSSKRANQARTAAQKYLSEIVRDSPVWINTATACKLGLRVDDVVEITTYRPKGRTYRATSEPSGKGVGFNINAILPIQPAPVTDRQSWYDTVCTLRKVLLLQTSGADQLRGRQVRDLKSDGGID